MSTEVSQSKRNPKLASVMRGLGLGKIVDSTRIRNALGIPVNIPSQEPVQAPMSIGMLGINIYAKYLNFACDLHALAFQEYLVSNGYNVKILDYKPVYYGNFNMRFPQEYANAQYQRALNLPSVTDEDIARKKTEVRKWKEFSEGYESVREERSSRYDKFQDFANKNLRLTKEKYDSDTLEVVDPGFDIYVCVTDVIWQSLNRHQFDRGFLLGSKAFEGKPTIAYAASRGASADYSEADKEKFLEYLADIDSVSVREKDFGDYIESISGEKFDTVIDPVMLHGMDFWDKYAKEPDEKDFVLLYYVMEKSTDTIQKAVDYAKANNLLLVEISDRPLKDGSVKDPNVRRISPHDVGMDEWLGYIKYADSVFTNSFHGCCFSVIFEQTMHVGRRNGSKVPNFLETFGLSGQQFDESTPIDELSSEINYDEVHRLWEKEREHAGAFIEAALEDAKQKVEANEEINHEPFNARRRQLEYPVIYRIPPSEYEVAAKAEAVESKFSLRILPSGAYEGSFAGATFQNDGSPAVPENPFDVVGSSFLGWNVRIKIDTKWFWLVQDGSLRSKSTINQPKKLLKVGEPMPHFSVNKVSLIVLEARLEDI